MKENLFFDWYSAGIDRGISEVQAALREYYPYADLVVARPQHGYTHADKLVDPVGETLVTFMYGGKAQGSRVHVFATGAAARKFACVVREVFPDHHLTRADVALDYDEPGAYQSLYAHGVKVSRQTSTTNRYVGPADAQMDESTVQGRTLYVGARSSVSMLRIYEKGKKDDRSRPDWVRVEYEFKPSNEAARLHYAKVSPSEILAATKLGVTFYKPLGAVVKADPVPAGTVRAPTSHERSLEALRRQYTATMLKQLELCGGDLHAFALSLLDAA